ncbi:hypothetical protein [Myxacorys almedinensis]|uniref:hypothetical protein n=1 Tax=Myxacorys almedinensis TaxID=2651157 RepID=UPI00192EE1A8|nr:hypothetical protein [Myxacorys almedinensis]
MDKVPFGAAFSKGLTLKMGQTHVHRYLRPLLERVQNGEIAPSLIIGNVVLIEHKALHIYLSFGLRSQVQVTRSDRSEKAKFLGQCPEYKSLFSRDAPFVHQNATP